MVEEALRGFDAELAPSAAPPSKDLRRGALNLLIALEAGGSNGDPEASGATFTGGLAAVVSSLEDSPCGDEVCCGLLSLGNALA